MLRWFLALFAALSIGSAVQAALLPRPEGPVLDAANIIPAADEAALDAKLRAYNASTGRALLVVTVPSLDGQDVQTYGVQLGQTWGVGGKATDQGLILLVAPNERRLRFEVGYGLEQYLPDVLAGRIIRDIITPRFKAGDYPGGIAAGIDAAITQLNRDPAEAKAVAEAAAAAEAQNRDGGGASFGGIIFWIVLIVVFMTMFRRGGGGKRYRRGGGVDAGIVLWGISEIARGMSSGGGGSGFSGGGGGGGGFGGFGGGGFGGGGASGGW